MKPPRLHRLQNNLVQRIAHALHQLLPGHVAERVHRHLDNDLPFYSGQQRTVRHPRPRKINREGRFRILRAGARPEGPLLLRRGNAGLRAVPSKANFSLVLFEGKLGAEHAYHGLMEAGYIVRWLPGQGLPHGLRITIGTEQEIRGLTAALRNLVEAAG